MPVITAIPVRPIARMDLEKYAEHLKKLDHEDRILRFCNAVKDEIIDHLVGRIYQNMSKGDDIVFGHFSPQGELVGAVAVSFMSDIDDGAKIAEVGISVLPEGRGQGIAKTLMERAILHAQNRGCVRLQTMCLVTNRTMDHLAKSVGMQVSGEFGERERYAHLPLDKPTFQSVGLETFLNQAAVWDEAVDRSAEYGKNLANAFFDRMSFAIPLDFGSSKKDSGAEEN